MRPFKHVAATQDVGRVTRPQTVFGVALTRFGPPQAAIPIAATTERDRITVFSWNSQSSRWDAIERIHAPLTADGTGPASPPTWSWSDRVGLAASDDTVFAVYKRAPIDTEGSPSAPELRIDRFQRVDPQSQRLRLIDSQVVPRFIPGRSLWCDFDASSGSLLIVGQRARDRPENTFGPFAWQLAIARVRFPAGPGDASFTTRVIADGGFDLDARLDERRRRLLIVHRTAAEAHVMPLAAMWGGGLEMTSGPSGDQFYRDLSLCEINLGTLDSGDDQTFVSESIPGGEHPQIQRTDPLLITFDRLRTTVRMNPPTPPLPPLQARPVWAASTVDKIAWLRQNGVDSRGTIMSFDADALPLSLAPFSQAVHLFQTDEGLLLHAMPFPFHPVYVLALDSQRKDLTLDLLHHRERLGLFRTRVSATVSDGEITTTSSAFEVWDIGHIQMRDPALLVPDGIPENAQFTPTEELPLSASDDLAVQPARADNTIGTHLIADLSREPVGFFGYTDAGDGGLRVIFAPDIRALPEPPPVIDEKTLRPEQVTGPHVPCEAWVEIPAADFIPSELPHYFVGVDLDAPSLGSTLEVPIDSIDLASQLVVRDDGTSVSRINGLTDRDFVDLDRVRLQGPPRELTLQTDDGRTVIVTLTPGAPVDGVPFEIAATVDGADVPILAGFTQVLPPDPLGLPQTGPPFPATGDPLTASLPTPGPWEMTVALTDTGARASDVIAVGESLRTVVWRIPEPLYEQLDIERLHVSFLQYELDYITPSTGARRVSILPAPERFTDMRFLGSGTGEQGAVDYRATVAVNVPGSGGGATIARVRGNAGLFLEVKELGLSFAYGRAFTTGMLMRDQRAANPLTREVNAEERSDVIRRTDPLRHAAIGGKPIGNTATSDLQIQFRVETNLLNATLAAIVTGLAIFGLAALAGWIASLFGLIALASGLGPWGAIVGLIAATLLFVALVFIVPREVERVVRERITAEFASGRPRQNLDAAAFLRFSGEGMAEAIGRKALEEAISQGHEVPAPETNEDLLGFDRFRGQTFQIVFVSAGLCGVLLRLDRCEEETDIGLPDPPSGPEDDDDPGGLPDGRN